MFFFCLLGRGSKTNETVNMLMNVCGTRAGRRGRLHEIKQMSPSFENDNETRRHSKNEWRPAPYFVGVSFFHPRPKTDNFYPFAYSRYQSVPHAFRLNERKTGGFTIK